MNEFLKDIRIVGVGVGAYTTLVNTLNKFIQQFLDRPVITWEMVAYRSFYTTLLVVLLVIGVMYWIHRNSPK